MTKNDFRDLFLRALNAAAEYAESELAKSIPRSYVIELHAPDVESRAIFPEINPNRIAAVQRLTL
jgi:hypothetical protein